MNNNSKHIKKGIYSDSVIFILNILIGFLAIPLYLKFISLEELGLYFSILGLVSVIGLANIGLGMYTEKKISNDNLFYSNDIDLFLSTIQIFQYLLGVVLLGIGFYISYYVADILGLNIHKAEISQQLFMYLWISLVLKVLFVLHHSILRSRHNLVFMNMSLFFISSLTIAFNIIFLYYGYGLQSFGIASITAIIIVNIIIMYKVFINYNLFTMLPTIFIKKYLIEGLNYIKQFQLLAISQISKTSLFTVLLSNYGGQTIVAQYNLTNKIPQMVPLFLSKLVINFFPSLSSHFELNELDKVRNIFKKIFSIGISAIIFFTFSIYFLNELFIELWVGSDKFIGSDIFILILINFIILALISFTGIILQTSGEFKKLPIISILEVLIFIVLSYILFNIYGLIGFFIGYILSMSIGLIYSFFVINRILDINVFEWMYTVIKSSIPLVFLMFIVNTIATNLIDSSLIKFITIFVIFISLFIIKYKKEYINV
ncbi:lipopolysaccharide biosynthesis protein [bacterium]|jgi:O-antigen/teichoic acid export membrane protein|nr:lipopolysaccharide biosynthesis protein [bacterium]